ncbi:MAG TPA: FAD-dependent oxidoreductase [Candidatus Limnocylindrales bacterium]
MTQRILILGGGFAGMSVARELTALLRHDGRLAEPGAASTPEAGAPAARPGDGRERVAIQLVDRDDYFVFQPLLADLLSSTVEATHVVVPLRRMLPDVSVAVGLVERIDTTARRVHLRRPLDGAPFELGYDALVIALGGVTDLDVVPGLREHALGFRTLGDAFFLRNRALRMLEAARVERDETQRARLLTFVVVGGGSTGVEAAASLHDLLAAAAATFHDTELRPRVVLVHGHETLLPHLGRRLGRVTVRRLRDVGVELILGHHVKRVAEDHVELDDGRRIETATVVSTVGNAPNPVLQDLPTRHDHRGWPQPEPTFALPGLDRVWALGDCASIVDPATGRPMAATAQFAVREGPHCARNVLAALDGQPQSPFRYRSQGMLVSLGRHRAVGDVLGVKVSGLLGWFLWRTYYLLRLPSLDRRVRVAMDWALDLFLPRDVVEIDVRRTRSSRAVGPGRNGQADDAAERGRSDLTVGTS